jgi:hypothetical protein
VRGPQAGPRHDTEGGAQDGAGTKGFKGRKRAAASADERGWAADADLPMDIHAKVRMLLLSPSLLKRGALRLGAQLAGVRLLSAFYRAATATADTKASLLRAFMTVWALLERDGEFLPVGTGASR